MSHQYEWSSVFNIVNNIHRRQSV